LILPNANAAQVPENMASSAELGRPSDAGRGRYVYLIKSPYSFKMGRSRRLKERTRFFGVKLPFKVELVLQA